MSESSPSPVPSRSRLRPVAAAMTGMLLALGVVLLAGCGADDERSMGSAAGSQSAPTAQDEVNGTGSTALRPSAATPDPVDPSHNPATPTPQSTGPTTPAP